MMKKKGKMRRMTAGQKKEHANGNCSAQDEIGGPKRGTGKNGVKVKGGGGKGPRWTGESSCQKIRTV